MDGQNHIFRDSTALHDEDEERGQGEGEHMATER